MNVNTLFATSVKAELPMGTFEATFEKIDYRIVGEDVTGAFIHSKEFDPIYIPVFEKDNVQLNFLCRQLGAKSFNPNEINSKGEGKKITCTRYKNQDYINASFNPKPKEDEDTDIFA